MNLGYVKMDKPKKGFFNNMLFQIRKTFNLVYKDKIVKENFYLCNLKDESKNKLIKLLKKNNIDYLIAEKGIDIEYKKLKGCFALKYLIPEVVKYCFRLIHPKIEEVFVCTNNFSNENVQIIKDLSSYVKVVNIISSNSRYVALEKELEKNNIYITVNNNKRTSLKRANVIVNLDFKDLKNYSINRNIIIIDISNRFNIEKGFDGIYIKGIKIGTEKVMRVFSEYENFEKEQLIEAEMVKIGKYDMVREYVKMNKFEIKQVIGERIINLDEFRRIEKFIS